MGAGVYNVWRLIGFIGFGRFRGFRCWTWGVQGLGPRGFLRAAQTLSSKPAATNSRAPGLKSLGFRGLGFRV